MATNPYVKFKRGLLKSLPTQIVDGTLYLTTDEGAIYLDNENERVRLGDVVAVDNIAALPAGGPKHQAVNGMIMYYAKAENVLARWDNMAKGWVQINAAGLRAIQAAGEVTTNDEGVVTAITGNGVSRVLTDASGLVTVTYGNFATAKEHATLSETVQGLADDIATLSGSEGGSISERLKAIQGETTSTIKDVEDKAKANDEAINGTNGILARLTATEGVANGAASAVADLEDVVAENKTAAEQAIADLKDGSTKTIKDLSDEIAANDGELTGLTNRLNALDADTTGRVAVVEAGLTAEEERALAAEQAIQAELDATQGDVSADYNSLAKLEAFIKQNAINITSNDTDILALQNADTALEGRVAANEEAIELLNGTAQQTGSVANTVAVEIAKVVGEGNAAAAFDTIVEIATYLSQHETDVVGMNNKINANETAIGTLQTDLGNLEDAVAENKTAAENAVAGLKTELLGDAAADYNTLGKLEDAVIAAKAVADAADTLSKANAGALTTANGLIGDNAEAISALTGVVAANKTAAEKAVTDAKAEIKGTTDAIAGRVTTAEGKITALEGDMATAKTDIVTNAEGVAANKAAVEKEVSDRAAAITALDTAYKAADSALDTRLTAIDAAGTGRMAVAEANITDIFELLTWGSF